MTAPDNALRPKLVLPGAAEALRWYADVLDAEPGEHFTHGEGADQRVVFASLTVFGTTVTLKDTDDFDPVPRPGPILDVVVEDPDHWAERMTRAGGDVVFPVADQPYGARGGRVRDPFGVQWLLSTPLRVSAEEAQVALDGSA